MWWLRELGGDLCGRVMLQWLHTNYQIQTQTDTCRLTPVAEISVTLFLYSGLTMLYCSDRNTHLHTLTCNMLLLLKTKQKSRLWSDSSLPSISVTDKQSHTEMETQRGTPNLSIQSINTSDSTTHSTFRYKRFQCCTTHAGAKKSRVCPSPVRTDKRMELTQAQPHMHVEVGGQ